MTTLFSDIVSLSKMKTLLAVLSVCILVCLRGADSAGMSGTKPFSVPAEISCTSI